MIGDSVSAAGLRLVSGSSSDLGEVIEVMDSAFDARFGEAWTRSQCAGILPMPGVSLMLARGGGERALGFSLQRTVADEAELLLIAVRANERRRGVGKLLLDNFLKSAEVYGASRVHLEVREGNPAVAMYRRAGFSAAGRRRKYYRGSDGSEYDALTLHRRI